MDLKIAAFAALGIVLALAVWDIAVGGLITTIAPKQA